MNFWNLFKKNNSPTPAQRTFYTTPKRKTKATLVKIYNHCYVFEFLLNGEIERFVFREYDIPKDKILIVGDELDIVYTATIIQETNKPISFEIFADKGE